MTCVKWDLLNCIALYCIEMNKIVDTRTSFQFGRQPNAYILRKPINKNWDWAYDNNRFWRQNDCIFSAHCYIFITAPLAARALKLPFVIGFCFPHQKAWWTVLFAKKGYCTVANALLRLALPRRIDYAFSWSQCTYKTQTRINTHTHTHSSQAAES